MKKKCFITSAVSFISLFLLVFTGCSDIDVKETSSVNNSLTINLGGSSERYIQASSLSLSSVEIWTLLFTDTDGNTVTLSCENKPSESLPEKTSPYAYMLEEKTILVNFLPAGTYTAALAGVYSDDDVTYTVTGIKSGIIIEENSNPTVSFVMNFLKTEEGTGSLNLTFTDSAGAFSNSYSSLSAALTGISNGKQYNSETDLTLGTYSNGSFTITGSNLLSGWYRLIISGDDSARVSIPEDCRIIEIADGITTASSIEISKTEAKSYYATNEKSSYNGLSAKYRANLSTLLKSIAASFPDEADIKIYMSDVPDIDLDVLESLKDAMSEYDSKIVSIYGSGETDTAALQVYCSESESDSTVLVSLSSSVSITAGTVTSAVFYDVTQNSQIPVTLKLKNGASVEITGELSTPFTLNIYLLTSDGSNNFAAYTESSAVVSDETDILSNLNVYDAETCDKSGTYSFARRALRTPYNYYLQNVSDS